MKRSIVSALLSFAALLGCAREPEYAGLDFDVLSAPPVLVNIQSDHLTLVAGVAVLVSVEPRSSEQDYDFEDRVSLRGGNATMLEVFAGKEEHEFVLVGLLAGDTCLEVSINRHTEECIPVHINDPAD